MVEEDPTPQISAYFWIAGPGLETAHCTKVIGLQPTGEDPQAVQTARFVTGEPYIRPPSWRFGITRMRSYSLSEPMEWVLEQIWPRREVIRQLLAELKPAGIEGSFEASVTIHEDRPVYELTAKVLRRMSYFGVDFGLDIWNFENEGGMA